MPQRRHPLTWLGLAALLAAGPAALFVPGAGTILLVLAVVASGIGVWHAWRPSSARKGRWIASVCLVVSAGILLWIETASLGLPSDVHRLERPEITRRYRLYRPPDAPRGRRLPAVLVYHGLMQRAHTIERISGFDRVAAEHGFLAVYPEGYRRSWNDTDTTKAATRAGIDDIGFVRDLIAELVREHGADPARIYATGLSNGGFLALRLACTLPEEIAAVATVGAGTHDAFPPDCGERPPAPALFLLGRDDPLVPWNSFGRSAERWAARLGCSGPAEETGLPDAAADGTRVRATRYDGCPAGAEALQLTIEGGGHTWPGGKQYLPRMLIGATSRDIDATEEIWRFFERHAQEEM